jgi:predicted TIM-barrel fold metal-dependent hydrolase
VHVKASAHFRVTTCDNSTAAQLKALLDVYGSSRIIWGSDYPFVTMEDGGYVGAVNILKDQVGDDEELLTELRGGNFAKLFPGAIEQA